MFVFWGFVCLCLEVFVCFYRFCAFVFRGFVCLFLEVFVGRGFVCLFLGVLCVCF